MESKPLHLRVLSGGKPAKYSRFEKAQNEHPSSNDKNNIEGKTLTHVSCHDTPNRVIQNFKSKDLRQFWETSQPRGINPKLAKKVEFLLDALDNATDIEQLNLPGTGLHQLTGQRQGQWSMVVSRNWRITFRFENGKAIDVDFEDYHRK